MFKFILRFNCIILTVMLLFPVTGFAQDVTWSNNIHVVEPNKSWKVLFSQQVDISTVNEDTVYVTAADGKKVKVNVYVSPKNSKLIVVEPPKGGYEIGKSYILSIEQGIHSYPINEILHNKVEKNFSIVKVPTDYFKLVQGTWETSYNGFTIKASFKNDFTSDIIIPGLLSSKGTYSVEGSKMALTILGRNVTGIITKVSDREFYITSASGNIMHFKK